MTAKQRALYDQHRRAAPRRGAGGLSTAYWRGFEFGKYPPLRSSLAYAAWLAGRDAKLLTQIAIIGPE